MTNQSTPSKRPIYVIDGLNVFLRSFMVNEAISNKSEPIGGVIGFLKFIHNINQNFSPSRIYVVWEAGGGSPRRKSLYPDYKANRAKVKDFKNLKTGGGNIKDVLRLDDNNKVQQLALLYRILNTTPVCQVFVKDTEGDDVTSFLIKERFSTDPLTSNTPKVIVSTDKDFYQLLDDPLVKIYDPAKKNFVDAKMVSEKFGISARNFCLAKAIVGDTSDNVEGIPGVGFKTAQKRFSGLLEASDRDSTIDDIMVECQTRLADKKTSKVKLYKDVLQGESVIRRNWKLMYLNVSSLSASQVEKINYTVDNHTPKMDKLGLIKTLIANGIGTDLDVNSFSSAMVQNLLYP